MKKLLGILAAVGLTATMTTSVVACGNNNKDNQSPNIKFSDYQSWVKQSANEENISIMFIGGRQNSDTYSYIAALNNWVYHTTPVIDKMFDKETVNDPANAISSVRPTTTSNDPTDYQGVIASDIRASTIAQSKPTSLDNADNQEWYRLKPGEQAKNIAINTILVNDITSFWKSSTLGGQIIDDLFNNQFNKYWETMQSKASTPNNGADQSSDKTKEQAKNKRRDDFNTMIKDGNGPYFLVFRNGKIANMTTGYANYAAYNTAITDKVDPMNQLTQQAGIDLTNLFKSLVSSTTTNYGTWINNIYAQLDQGNSDSIWVANKEKVYGWNKRTFNGTNNVPDPNALKPKTDETNTNSEKNVNLNTQLIFKLNWKE